MNKSSSKLTNPIEKSFTVLTPYHYYFFFILFLCKIPIYWHVLNLIFLSPPMEYICNDDKKKNGCPCNEPEWNRSVFTQTSQTKFNIHCETTWLLSFSQSMLYVGTLIGSLLFGFLSDRYGRLFTFTLANVALAIFGSLVSLMPTIASFAFMRCLEGFGLGGAVVTSYVFCVELCSAKHREVITALYHIPINVSLITLAGISYFLRDCDKFQLAISIPVFFIVSIHLLTLESPKWLMDNHEVDKAATVMEKIARFNRSPTGTIREEIVEYLAMKAKTTTKKKMKFWQIFKHKRITLNFLCMSVVYFVCGMGYYGVSQYIGMMSGDIHANVAISGTLLLPGTLASIFLLKILKRRSFLIATNSLSGIFMIIVVCVPSHLTWVRVVIACVCNTFFFMSFIIVFLFGVELFPTSIRNAVLGVLCVLARVGQVIAPLVNTSTEIASGLIFGIMALVAAVMSYPLPETKGVELPSSLEDTKTLRIPKKSAKPNQNRSVTVEEQQ